MPPKSKETKIVPNLLDALASPDFLRDIVSKRQSFTASDHPEIAEAVSSAIQFIADDMRRTVSYAVAASIVTPPEPQLIIVHTPQAQKKAARSKKELLEHAESLRPTLKGFQDNGITQQKDILAALNADLEATPTPYRTGRWHRPALRNVYKRLAENGEALTVPWHVNAPRGHARRKPSVKKRIPKDLALT